jgi:hypothetical protein
MRITQFVVVLLLAALALPRAALSAEDASVRAILFVASNEKGGTDPRLAPYEPTLRRVLRFESYRFLSESSTSVSAGGKARINLQGQPIEVENDNGRVKVSWNGTTVAVPAGRPAVIGGRPHGKGGVEGVIVTVN